MWYDAPPLGTQGHTLLLVGTAPGLADGVKNGDEQVRKEASEARAHHVWGSAAAEAAVRRPHGENPDNCWDAHPVAGWDTQGEHAVSGLPEQLNR